ncbi:hypothetical protein [Thalassotalea sp. ND16A]|uniref:hypothetical protein n=1 Tax=Thalassotalea sp. ND16A TaxID=1535422 RepID=UPI001F246A06|nr:hypothetical protein [Thalassotalea sp. ND16A]
MAITAVLFIVELLKQHSVQQSLMFAVTWAFITTAIFVGSRLYQPRKGIECALCNDTPETNDNNIKKHGVKMKVWLSMLVSFMLLLPFPARSAEQEFNYDDFINNYFAAWVNVQNPKASTDDLEHYLSFLTDDVGYQHLPYSTDDSRQEDGKKGLRKGMTYYLGIHTEYSAKLTNTAYGHNVIMIEFDTQAKGVHPDNGQLMTFNHHSFEVLEIDNGKVSVIRHYSK